MKDEILQQLKDLMIKKYSESKFNIYFAPGRVNLIGEHTDYTGGLVFPAGLNLGTYIAVYPNNSDTISVYSKNFDDGIHKINLRDKIQKSSHWTDYVKGMILEIEKYHSIKVRGFNAIIYGTIPNGSGLSSSASFEMTLICTLTDLNGFSIPNNGTDKMTEYAVLGKNCENNFIGVNCGIMDQFASANAKKGYAVQLDCHDLSFKYSPIQLNDYSILIINSNKKRRLEESKYNERRLECEIGFKLLQKLGISKPVLGRVTSEEWDIYKEKIDNGTLKKRLNHVIEENNRVKKAFIALSDNDITTFSDLLNESGDSLRDDFEVTGFHLDTLVDITRQCNGVLAARMTGAGFGGCTVNIIKSSETQGITEEIETHYIKQTGIRPDFYFCTIEDGASKIL